MEIPNDQITNALRPGNLLVDNEAMGQTGHNWTERSGSPFSGYVNKMTMVIQWPSLIPITLLDRPQDPCLHPQEGSFLPSGLPIGSYNNQTTGILFSCYAR